MPRKFSATYRALVSNYGGDSVTPLIFQGNTWTGDTDIPVTQPRTIALVPGGNRAVVASIPGGFVPFTWNPSTGHWVAGALVSSGSFGSWGVAVDYFGRLALTANSATVTAYSYEAPTDTWTADSLITTGLGDNLSVCITPDGLHALVTAKFSAFVAPLDYSPGSNTWSPGSLIATQNTNQFDLAITPDGQLAIISGQSGPGPTMLKLNASTGLWENQGYLPIGGCNGVSIAPDSQRALIVDSTLTKVIPLTRTGSTWSVGTEIPLGVTSAAYISIIQDGIGDKALVTAQSSNAVVYLTYDWHTHLWTPQYNVAVTFNQPLGLALTQYL